MSIRDWFIEPRAAPAGDIATAPAHPPASDIETAVASPLREPAGDVATAVASPLREPAGDVATAVASPLREPAGVVATAVASPLREPAGVVATAVASPAHEPAGDVATTVASPAHEPAACARPEPVAWTHPEPERFHSAPRLGARASESHAADAATARASGPRGVAPPPPHSAAVIGRPGDAEPVAAALALALRGAARAPAATVVVVVEDAASPAAAGAATRGARRLAARLAAHGFEASARGRLAWVHVPEVAAGGAAGIGVPTVVAVTVPLSSALEAVVSEQELVIVVAPGGDGPLARLAAASLARPGLAVRCIPPLPRGIARVLARAGLRAPSELRRLA